MAAVGTAEHNRAQLNTQKSHKHLVILRRHDDLNLFRRLDIWTDNSPEGENIQEKHSVAVGRIQSDREIDRPFAIGQSVTALL
jgi:hypothetical protein